MSDYITLLGTEEVRRAGSSMVNAADKMVNAANGIENSLLMFRQFLEDWIQRLEYILNEKMQQR